MPDGGARLFGRELDAAETAVTVRVRDGQTLLSDETVLETGDFFSRINVIECADLDLAVRSISGSGARRSRQTPYLLLAWIGPAPAAVLTDRELIDEIEVWRREVDEREQYVMGSSFGGIEAAVTQRLRDARTLSADSPFNEVDGTIVAIDVILASDRRQAIALAAAHPLAQAYAVEVRPFLSD